MTERLVVIGGDAAGMSAASQARRLRGPDDLEILAFERGTTTSYSACGIPYWVAGLVEERDDLVARSPEEFRQRQDIDVRTGHEVTAIDPDARCVRVRDLGTGTEADHGYDEVLIATGAEPLRPPVSGIDAEGVFGVQNLDDGERILDAVAARDPQTAVVIGAGYIGIEMAEAMLLRGLQVHVVELAEAPMVRMGPELGGRIAEEMRELGIHVHLGVPVEAVNRGADGWVSSVVFGGRELACDLVVLGAGTRPASGLAREAGIPVGPSGGIVTDRRQRTPVDGVWAAGDCAETFHRVSRQPVSIALGTIANKQGRVAGLNLGGDYGTFPGVLGTAITRICELEIALTGLDEDEARHAGFSPVTATVDSTTRAHYFPGAEPITITMVAERGTGRLLGARILGREGAGKRIDVLAMAVWNEMTVDELSQVDLSYAPPFSPVWDPVLRAARASASAVGAAG